MTKSANRAMSTEEIDIKEHAERVGLHVKKAGPHSGHCWYCFDCQGACNSHQAGSNFVSHHTFDSNEAMKQHLTTIHGIHWCSAYYEPEDAA